MGISAYQNPSTYWENPADGSQARGSRDLGEQGGQARVPVGGRLHIHCRQGKGFKAACLPSHVAPRGSIPGSRAGARSAAGLPWGLRGPQVAPASTPHRAFRLCALKPDTGWRCACLRKAGLRRSRPPPSRRPSQAWQGARARPGALEEAPRKSTAGPGRPSFHCGHCKEATSSGEHIQCFNQVPIQHIPND